MNNELGTKNVIIRFRIIIIIIIIIIILSRNTN